ncbi:aspartic peptidase domain-containing protein [Phascolomyces articulosus]|uniref:Aspartic peptidase domain-containing protein n=1 Tax=Phascolomyces articulosus TaxID=60185 RepID=A0AAD5KS54_9FUNG|nr:aspartic peptidase domain-containing protein [Phascolomyces articulosus]
MLLCSSITLALLALSSTSASAVPETLSRITVPLVRNYNGQLAQEKRSLRFDKRQEQQQDDSVLNSEFLIEIEIGEPSQRFNVTVDTASSQLWVPSTSEAQTQRRSYEQFNATASSTFKPSQVPFTMIDYKGTQVNGSYGVDTVTLGGSLKVDQQVVGLVNDRDNQIFTEQSQNYGVIGFGFPGLNLLSGNTRRDHNIPVVFNLLYNNVISEPVFSVYFDKEGAGELSIGGIDESKLKENDVKLTYAPVLAYHVKQPPEEEQQKKKQQQQQLQTTYLYWVVAGLRLDSSFGYEYDFSSDDKKKTIAYQPLILDTGSALSYAPRPVVDDIIASLIQKDTDAAKYDESLFATGAYTIDCSYGIPAEKTKDKDFIQFNIATGSDRDDEKVFKLTVPIHQLVIPLDNDDVKEAKTCVFGIAPVPSVPENEDGGRAFASGGSYFLGESVLRSVYTVYDMEQYRVGFASLLSF